MDLLYIHNESTSLPDRHLKFTVTDDLVSLQVAVPSELFNYTEGQEVEAFRLDTRDGFVLETVKIPGVVPGEDFDPSLAGHNLCVYPEAHISLTHLKSRFEWKDHCIWDLIPSGGDYGPVHYYRNTTADAGYQRRHYRDTPYTLGYNTLLCLYVPFASVESFQEIGLRTLLLSKNSRLISNVEWKKTECTSDGMFPGTGIFSELEMTGPETIRQDGTAELTVQATRWGEMVQHPIQLELETINGYLPVTRLNTSGPATFRASALGLKPGETMKVKAGYRFFPGLCDHTMQVVE